MKRISNPDSTLRRDYKSRLTKAALRLVKKQKEANLAAASFKKII
jgi:hypothetical protein